MNLEFFLQRRRTSWQRMETLLQQAGADPRRLSAQELDELGLLYRSLTSDLALAQRDFPQQQVTRYLNQLVGRAHTLIYRGEPLRRRQLTHFYQRGFPQLYRALLPYTIAAFVLFLAEIWYLKSSAMNPKSSATTKLAGCGFPLSVIRMGVRKINSDIYFNLWRKHAHKQVGSHVGGRTLWRNPPHAQPSPIRAVLDQTSPVPAAAMIGRNASAVRLAPPTNAPPTPSAASSSAAFPAFTEPP